VSAALADALPLPGEPLDIGVNAPAAMQRLVLSWRRGSTRRGPFFAAMSGDEEIGRVFPEGLVWTAKAWNLPMPGRTYEGPASAMRALDREWLARASADQLRAHAEHLSGTSHRLAWATAPDGAYRGTCGGETVTRVRPPGPVSASLAAAAEALGITLPGLPELLRDAELRWLHRQVRLHAALRVAGGRP